MAKLYVIFRLDDGKVLYKGGSYGFNLIVNRLEDLQNLAFRIVRKESERNGES